MEDAHAAILDYKADGVKEGEGPKNLSFFGVYDGHGGDKVAIYAGEQLHKIIAKQQSFKEGKIDQALKDGFLATDRAILSGKAFYKSLFCPKRNPLTLLVDPKYEEEVSGCTASVGVVGDDKIYVVCAWFFNRADG